MLEDQRAKPTLYSLFGIHVYPHGQVGDDSPEDGALSGVMGKCLEAGHVRQREPTPYFLLKIGLMVLQGKGVTE